MNYTTIIIIAFVGIGLGYWLARRKRAGEVGEVELNLPAGKAGQREVKEENKQKVLEYLQTNDKMTNNDVERMLGVSDATATRYMDDLEKEGKVEQVGTTGNAVHYKLSK